MKYTFNLAIAETAIIFTIYKRTLYSKPDIFPFYYAAVLKTFTFRYPNLRRLVDWYKCREIIALAKKIKEGKL